MRYPVSRVETMHRKDTRVEDKCIIIGRWNSSHRLREGKLRRSSLRWGQNKSNTHNAVGEATAVSRQLSPIRFSYGGRERSSLASAQCDGFR